MASVLVKPASDPATSDLRVPLFPSDRKEFSNWKRKMMKYLRGKGLLSAILQKPKYIPYEKKVTDAEYAEWVVECEEKFLSAEEIITSKKGKEMVRNEDVQFKIEVTRHVLVVSILSQSFKQKQEDLVCDVFEDNAYATWETIVKKYEITKSGDSIEDLLQQLHVINRLENEEISVYLARVDKIVSTLATLNFTVQDEMKRFYILQGLRSDTTWKSIVDLIDQVDHDKQWTIQHLQDHLIAQENRILSGKQRAARQVVTVSQQVAAVSVDTDVAAFGMSGGRGGYSGRGNGRGRRGGHRGGRGGGGYGRGGYSNNYNQNNNQNQNNNNNNQNNNNNNQNQNNNQNNNNQNNNQQSNNNSNSNSSSSGSASANNNDNQNNNNNNNNNNSNNNKHYQDKSNIQCYGCDKWGHYKSECWGTNKRGRHQSYSAIADVQVQQSQSHPLSSSTQSEIAYVGDDEYYDDGGLSSVASGVCMRELNNAWILDSGATSHHTGNKELLTNISKLDRTYKTVTGDGSSTYDQVGVAIVSSGDDVFKLSQVLYVPTFKVNLISVSRLTDRGCKVVYDSEEAVVMRDGRVIFTAVKENNLYIVRINKNNNNNEHVTHAFLSNNNKVGEEVEAEANGSDQNKQKHTYMNELKKLHFRYGHASYTKLMNIITHNSVDGVSDVCKDRRLLKECIGELIRSECKGCLLGKMSRLPMKGVVDHNVIRHMDLWVVDVMGPMKIETMKGQKYVLVIIDVFTRYVFVKLMKTKGESATLLIDQIKQSQTQTELKLKELHSDGGKELVNGEVSEFLGNNGTKQTTTTPHTPEHNGIVERANRTIMDMARSMLFHCDAYVPMWGDAVLMAAYLIRMSLTNASPTNTPTELWSKQRPSVNHLHVFGCNAYYHVHKTNRDGKLDKQAKLGIFVGYDEDNRTYYKIYDVDVNKFIISRDIVFYDESFTEMKRLKDEEKTRRESDSINDDDALPELTDDMLQQLFNTDHTTPNTHTNVLNVGNASAQVGAHPATSSSVVSPVVSSLVVSRNSMNHNNELEGGVRRDLVSGNDTRTSGMSLRGWSDVGGEASTENRVNRANVNETNKKKRKDESVSEVPRRGRGRPRKQRVVELASAAVDRRISNASTSEDDDYDPETYEQATNSKDRSAWLDAIEDELRAHRNNNTWSVIRRDTSINVIDTKWVFTRKRDENGVVKRFKARVVAKGYNQQYGVDYKETFAPVIKMKSLRLIIALSSTRKTKRKLAQIDVKTAFLNASVKENIYVSAPKGMNIGAGLVLKLNKALYGIKQAPHEWNNEINSYILSLGFKQCVSDTCVYVKMSKTGNIIILGLFVDDMIISYDDRDENEWFELKGMLVSKYELSDEGEANVIVGMKLTRKHGCVYVDQRAYIREKLDEFGMDQCKPASTPGDGNVWLNDSKGEVDKQTYMQIVGSLIYTLHTRPDVAHAINMVCRFMSEPNATHMRAAKRVLRYLCGTTSYGLKYANDEDKHGGEVNIECYCDADWAGDKEDRKSTTGYCVYVNDNLISWNTKKQQSVALSTAEAELMAVVDVVREAMWMSMLLTEIGYKVKKPMSVWCDNQAAISLSKHDSDHNRTKHIDIRYYFIRDEMKKGEVDIKWIRSEEQVADIFTKSLTYQPFLTHRSALVHNVSA
jgi:hypothetical protein